LPAAQDQTVNENHQQEEPRGAVETADGFDIMSAYGCKHSSMMETKKPDRKSVRPVSIQRRLPLIEQSF
jgi:hypothetical protein